MIFTDRQDAGKHLAQALQQYSNAKDTVVIGLPRGGVVLAHTIAKDLHLPLDIICPRKIGAPSNPEYAVGAVTETGEHMFDEDAIIGISQEYLQEAIKSEKAQAQRRLAVFRQGMKPRDLKGKTVILVDDGLATGMTMKAAIISARKEGASKTIVAVPVSPWDTLQEIKTIASQVVCLSTPSFFHAVGEFYKTFTAVEDDEVIALIKEFITH